MSRSKRFTPIILSASGGSAIGSFLPESYGASPQLGKHSSYGNPLVRAVVAKALFLRCPFTLVWHGEDTDIQTDVLPPEGHPAFDPKANQGKVHRDYPRMAERAARVDRGQLYRIPEDDRTISGYAGPMAGILDEAVIYDHVTRQCLDLATYRGGGEGLAHPLPLLTCIGYDGYDGPDAGWVGAWALHLLEIRPAGSPPPDGKPWEDVSDRFAFDAAHVH